MGIHVGRVQTKCIGEVPEGFGEPPAAVTNFAQFVQSPAHQSMFESFGIRKPETTGIVQWMLNAAWPKLA